MYTAMHTQCTPICPTVSLTPAEVVAATLQLLLALLHSPPSLTSHILDLALGLPCATSVVILTEGHHTEASRCRCGGAQGSRQVGAAAAVCSSGLQESRVAGNSNGRASGQQVLWFDMVAQGGC